MVDAAKINVGIRLNSDGSMQVIAGDIVKLTRAMRSFGDSGVDAAYRIAANFSPTRQGLQSVSTQLAA